MALIECRHDHLEVRADGSTKCVVCGETRPAGVSFWPSSLAAVVLCKLPEPQSSRDA